MNDDKPNDEKITEWKEAPKTMFNTRMIEDYLECSRVNSKLNEEKAKHLDEAQTTFFYAMIMIPIVAVLAIATRLMS